MHLSCSRSSIIGVSLLLVSFPSCTTPAGAAAEPAAPSQDSTESYASQTEGLRRADGFFTTWTSTERGHVLLELPAPSMQQAPGFLAQCLYVEGLTTGLGSNDVGLDRGQVGPSRVLVLRELAGRVLFELPNLAYRSLDGDEGQRAATRDSFATSILWSTPLLARGPSGERLIDLTGFLVRDAHNSARKLQGSGGSWSLDLDRSSLLPAASLAFPDNLEFEALLTFQGKDASWQVREVAPAADAVTLTQHHSFIRLPDDDYTPRAWDPRAGAFAQSFTDTSSATQSPSKVSYAVRHRLQKVNTSAVFSAPREAIVYYVDSAAPEPVRSALVEGASWWSTAFEAAGFRDAFRVELLPEGVHPLDVRYNVIQWVQRSSRGWSYGGGIRDPRTGEMIKGHVTLGALRVRQDLLLFESLVGTEETGSGSSRDPLEASLARLRQLAAHEVGHTLGLSHNFAASTYGRASVMDYPAPLVELVPSGTERGAILSLENAYAVGMGAWDLFAIRHLYADLLPEQEGQRAGWVDEAYARGLVYLSDGDARAAGAADPRANLWDNGDDALQGLRQVLEVRAVGLAQFDGTRLEAGEPTALLEELFVPLFFLHRYQVDAASKVVGGRTYQHALTGDGRSAVRVVAAEEQRRALDLLLHTLRSTVDVPPVTREILAPATLVSGRRRELFRGRSAPNFDELGLAEGAARLVISNLLVPERLERLVQQSEWDSEQLGLEELLARLVEWCLFADAPLSAARQAVVQHALVDEFLELAANPAASPHVRAAVESTLDAVRANWEAQRSSKTADESALVRRIERFLARPSEWTPERARVRVLPPGSPIGCSDG